MTFYTLSKRKVEFDESFTLDIGTSSSETVFLLFHFTEYLMHIYICLVVFNYCNGIIQSENLGMYVMKNVQ